MLQGYLYLVGSVVHPLLFLGFFHVCYLLLHKMRLGVTILIRFYFFCLTMWAYILRRLRHYTDSLTLIGD